jgi:hypothetical protein
MYAHPEEAADIIAAAYRLDPAETRLLMAELIKVKVDGRPYFNEGRFYLDGIVRMLKMQENVGSVTGPYDLAASIDMRFLPADLQEPVK